MCVCMCVSFKSRTEIQIQRIIYIKEIIREDMFPGEGNNIPTYVTCKQCPCQYLLHPGAALTASLPGSGL